MKEEIITKEKHPEIFNWLMESVFRYKHNVQNIRECFRLTTNNKINVYHLIRLEFNTTQIKYPFEYVRGGFDCSQCYNLTSLINSPEKIDGYFSCSKCEKLMSFIGLPKKIKNEFYFTLNNFSNRPKDKEQYRFYLAMWMELLESVNNEERLEYIKNYKDEKAYNNLVITIEILKEYGF